MSHMKIGAALINMDKQTNQHDSKLFNMQETVESYVNEQLRQKYKDIEEFDIELTWPRFTHQFVSAVKAVPGIPTLQQLNSQNFRNASNRTQTHTFRASRTSNSRTTVSVLQGLVPPQAGFPIELPDGTPGSDVLLSGTHTTVQDRQQWEVNTPIKVPPGTASHVELLIEETEQTYSFAIHTDIEGVMKVKVKKDGRLISRQEHALVDILRDIPGVSYKIGDNVLTLETVGEMNLRYGITQLVNIQESPLEEIGSSENQTTDDSFQDTQSVTKLSIDERKELELVKWAAGIPEENDEGIDNEAFETEESETSEIAESESMKDSVVRATGGKDDDDSADGPSANSEDNNDPQDSSDRRNSNDDTDRELHDLAAWSNGTSDRPSRHKPNDDTDDHELPDSAAFASDDTWYPRYSDRTSPAPFYYFPDQLHPKKERCCSCSCAIM